MNKKCPGCGATLQYTNKNEKGYVIKEKYEDNPYCERCFKIINYNERITTNLENINEYIIKEVNNNADYVYFLIDLLNINEETTNTFKQITKPKTLIISKTDIIPKSIKENKIISFIQNNYNINEEILFQSTKKNINTKNLITNLENNNIKKTYILGYTNAGKSTLINKFLSYSEEESKPITTSSNPNTTIDFIKIKINENLYIYDSPGFTLKNTLYKEDEFNLIKRLNPKAFIKPITYQVKPITSILLEDKIRINSNIDNSFTFYVSNELKTTKVFENNEDLTNLKLLKIKIPNNTDLVIKGIGFINIKKSCELKININDENIIEIRKSIFQN